MKKLPAKSKAIGAVLAPSALLLLMATAAMISGFWLVAWLYGHPHQRAEVS